MPPPTSIEDHPASTPNSAFVLVPFFLSSTILTVYLCWHQLKIVSGHLAHGLLLTNNLEDEDEEELGIPLEPLGRDLESRYQHFEYEALQRADPDDDNRELRHRSPSAFVTTFAAAGQDPLLHPSTGPDGIGRSRRSELSPELDKYFDKDRPGVARYQSQHRGQGQAGSREDSGRWTSGWDVTMGNPPDKAKGWVEGRVARRVDAVADGFVDWVEGMARRGG